MLRREYGASDPSTHSAASALLASYGRHIADTEVVPVAPICALCRKIVLDGDSIRIGITARKEELRDKDGDRGVALMGMVVCYICDQHGVEDLDPGVLVDG